MAIKVESGDEAVKGIAYSFVQEQIDTLLAVAKMYKKCGCGKEVDKIREAIKILMAIQPPERKP